MILADTSVWVDHLRAGDKALAALLDAGMVLAHPFVIGELALGNLRRRDIVLKAMMDLPCVVVARTRRSFISSSSTRCPVAESDMSPLICSLR